MILTKPARPTVIVRHEDSAVKTVPAVSKTPKPIKIASVANGILDGILTVTWESLGNSSSARRAIKISFRSDGWHHRVLGINRNTLRYLSKYKDETGSISIKGLFLVYPKNFKGKLAYQIVAFNPSTSETGANEFTLQGIVQSIEESRLKGHQSVSVRIKPSWRPSEAEPKRPKALEPFTVEVQVPNKLASGIIQVGAPVSINAVLDRAFLMFKNFRPSLIEATKLS